MSIPEDFGTVALSLAEYAETYPQAGRAALNALNRIEAEWSAIVDDAPEVDPPNE